LKIELFDREENIKVELISRKVKIDPTRELIKTLNSCTDGARLITA